MANDIGNQCRRAQGASCAMQPSGEKHSFTAGARSGNRRFLIDAGLWQAHAGKRISQLAFGLVSLMSDPMQMGVLADRGPLRFRREAGFS
jgi:hypothetical protein